MLKSLIFYAAAPGKNGGMLNKTLILLLIFRYSFVFVLLLLLLLPMLLGYPNYFRPAAMLAHVLFVLSLLHCISEYL
jgi:hypothetical protein